METCGAPHNEGMGTAPTDVTRRRAVAGLCAATVAAALPPARAMAGADTAALPYRNATDLTQALATFHPMAKTTGAVCNLEASRAVGPGA